MTESQRSEAILNPNTLIFSGKSIGLKTEVGQLKERIPVVNPSMRGYGER
jgi:hypothetical protein